MKKIITTILAALMLALGAPLAAFATVVSPVNPPTVEVSWLMPEGASDTNVLWDQTHLPDGVVPCGRWAQLDVYLVHEAAKFTADGILKNGEDHQTKTQRGAISWRFVYGGDCPPVVVPPVEPPVVVPPVVEPPVVVPPVDPPVVVPPVVDPPVVVAPPADLPLPPAVVEPIAAPPVLAATGASDLTPMLVAAAALLTLGGGVLVFAVRRRVRA